jgi:hypothetical protein
METQPVFTKHQWQDRVKHEFGVDSVKQFVQESAADRWSMKTTALMMSIQPETLKRYCRIKNIEFPDRMQLRDDCKPKPLKKGIIRNPYGRKGKP